MNNEKNQKEVNNDFGYHISKLYGHARVANEEMGHIKEDMSEVKTDIKWLKRTLDSLENKTWFIVTGIILSILIQIFFNL